MITTLATSQKIEGKKKKKKPYPVLQQQKQQHNTLKTIWWTHLG
jgi:hypothetical protein